MRQLGPLVPVVMQQDISFEMTGHVRLVQKMVVVVASLRQHTDGYDDEMTKFSRMYERTARSFQAKAGSRGIHDGRSLWDQELTEIQYILINIRGYLASRCTQDSKIK